MKLVSIIIPCFNAERWIAEAIDSALKQTYPQVEVIVIDDGSTDGSLDIIKRYENKIRWESKENQGGNYARNRGFSLSTGSYIQYLDADDYLLPQKIEKQTACLLESGADAIYGDWRHQQHLDDGTSVLEGIKTSGYKEDVLEALLSGWWVSPACLLFTRTAVEKAGGWDEQLQAGQDRDFFTAVAMSGAVVVYQPECDSIYRRYGNVTVSTQSKGRYLSNHQRILEKNEQQLSNNGKLTEKYQKALAQSYFILARACLETDWNQYRSLLDKALALYPKFKANSAERSRLYTFFQSFIGFRNLERLVVYGKRVKAGMSMMVKNQNGI